MRKNGLWEDGGVKDYDSQIAQLRKQIALATEQLRRLEAERQSYINQCYKRSQYMSSREILDFLSARHGRTGSMATITRWANAGHLGEVIEERQAFPLLAGTQGRKRFLYPKRDVCRFLHEKGLLLPAYDVLDRVKVHAGSEPRWAVVVSSSLIEDRFFYNVQLEETREMLTNVPEEEITRE